MLHRGFTVFLRFFHLRRQALQRGICVYTTLAHASCYSSIVYSGVLLYSLYVSMLQRGITLKGKFSNLCCYVMLN